jgi:hypothetical protein
MELTVHFTKTQNPQSQRPKLRLIRQLLSEDSFVMPMLTALRPYRSASCCAAAAVILEDMAYTAEAFWGGLKSYGTG